MESHHENSGHQSHGHSRGTIDPTIVTTQRGIWAVKWSFVILFVTALLQILVVLLSNSIALLADTIHNFGDAATAIPLWIAFAFARLKPNKRFPFGYGRVEDFAGVAVIITILFSAVVAGYEAINRFLHPSQVNHLWAVIAASIMGFVGNEGVALFRIKVGKEIGSAALIADGYHARVDGWTSLAVLFGAVGVWLGYPVTDPLVGFGISVAILFIVWDSGKAVFSRMLDGVEPEVLKEIIHSARHVKGVEDVGEARARWIGHRLHAELNIAVHGHLSVTEGHEIAKEVRHQLLHHLKHVGNVIVHIDPEDRVGEAHHKIVDHSHDGLPIHSH